ncbi:DNA polymerase IV [Bifidobacterium magnum]|uniref:DNA polymerase IV n=1 Tax=Bifidobacterium magnum TaxID=1692 RepID=A0A087BBA5_9BIFI|nr:DNA polymerase IV [Bifidobacterium magnum]KFI68305.1 DNA polymerase IV [Bifidobacterium magnum]
MSNAPRNAAANRDWGHDETGCTVLHIDMDAFYASLEIARHPELSGRPVVIGMGNRAVVSAANYEARKFGIYSSMPSAKARQLCPHAAFLPVDIAYYRTVSHQIFTDIFSKVTDQIEQVSVDECYMDVSGALLRWHSTTQIGAWLRAQVANHFHITCSVGIAANKLVAKMASTNAKPNGMLLIPRALSAEFLQMMPLRAIPGIGPSMERKLLGWGVTSVTQLAQLSELELAGIVKSPTHAHRLYLACRGMDERKVTPYTPEKSIGCERTFDEDTRDESRVAGLLRHCCDKVAHSLRDRGLLARTVSVKLRFDDLSYATRTRQLDAPTDAASKLFPFAVEMLHALLGMDPSRAAYRELPRAVRLAGVSVSSLTEASRTAVQLSLDDMLDEQQDEHHSEAQSQRLREAERALDAVRNKFGSGAAHLGA